MIIAQFPLKKSKAEVSCTIKMEPELDFDDLNGIVSSECRDAFECSGGLDAIDDIFETDSRALVWEREIVGKRPHQEESLVLAGVIIVGENGFEIKTTSLVGDCKAYPSPTVVKNNRYILWWVIIITMKNGIFYGRKQGHGNNGRVIIDVKRVANVINKAFYINNIINIWLDNKCFHLVIFLSCSYKFTKKN